MKIGIPKEIQSGENRVAITPKIGKRLVARGFELYVETGAGKGAQFTDQDYETCGTTICNAKELYENSDIILKVQPPTEEEIGMMKAETLLLSYIYPVKIRNFLQNFPKQK